MPTVIGRVAATGQLKLRLSDGSTALARWNGNSEPAIGSSVLYDAGSRTANSKVAISSGSVPRPLSRWEQPYFTLEKDRNDVNYAAGEIWDIDKSIKKGVGQVGVLYWLPGEGGKVDVFVGGATLEPYFVASVQSFVLFQPNQFSLHLEPEGLFVVGLLDYDFDSQLWRATRYSGNLADESSVSEDFSYSLSFPGRYAGYGQSLPSLDLITSKWSADGIGEGFRVLQPYDWGAEPQLDLVTASSGSASNLSVGTGAAGSSSCIDNSRTINASITASKAAKYAGLNMYTGQLAQSVLTTSSFWRFATAPSGGVCATTVQSRSINETSTTSIASTVSYNASQSATANSVATSIVLSQQGSAFSFDVPWPASDTYSGSTTQLTKVIGSGNVGLYEAKTVAIAPGGSPYDLLGWLGSTDPANIIVQVYWDGTQHQPLPSGNAVQMTGELYRATMLQATATKPPGLSVPNLQTLDLANAQVDVSYYDASDLFVSPTVKLAQFTPFDAPLANVLAVSCIEDVS